MNWRCWFSHDWQFADYQRDFGTDHMVAGFVCRRCKGRKIKLETKSVFSEKDFEWLRGKPKEGQP